jgi:hypothetical protein
MKDSDIKLAYLKRAKPVLRDTVLTEMSKKSDTVHPLVEKASRAISDWHSEVDWPIHTDRAIRCVEVIAEHLGREGFREAKDYLQTVVWREPKHRVP